MVASKAQPIIVRRGKRGGHSHHGGAWKVAYADFVTAMMAFFLLLWLLNAVSREQLEGISDYFAPISTHATTSGGGGLLAGKTVAKRGVFEVDAAHAQAAAQESRLAATVAAEDEGEQDISDEELARQLRKREEEQFREAERQLRQAIGDHPELGGLAKSLIIDDTPEGLRIQIIDQEGLPMFPRGEAEMFAHTRQVLELVAKVVQRMPQDVDITGHTDATRYQGGGSYSNWELSADRANAARRVLSSFGVPEGRFARIVGKAATEPLFPRDPEASGNRRLSVLLLRGTGPGK
jgi:chemotaxis protein MotB